MFTFHLPADANLKGPKEKFHIALGLVSPLSVTLIYNRDLQESVLSYFNKYCKKDGILESPCVQWQVKESNVINFMFFIDCEYFFLQSKQLSWNNDAILYFACCFIS